MRETACRQAKIVDRITAHRAHSAGTCLPHGQPTGWVLILVKRDQLQAFARNQTPRDSALPCNAIVPLVLPGFGDSRHACSKGSQEAFNQLAYPIRRRRIQLPLVEACLCAL